MVDEPHLRLFDPNDLPSVMRITEEAFGKQHPPIFFIASHQNAPDAFIVAEGTDGPVGYVMCMLEPSVIVPWYPPYLRGHVMSIAVSNEYKGRGVGRHLMESALTALVRYGASQCYLEVRVDNPVAINLYHRLGFQTVGRIPRYYHDGFDAFVMTKALP